MSTAIPAPASVPVSSGTVRRALGNMFARSPRQIEQSAALLIVFGIVSGVAVVGLVTPIAGRGDFGQWLMASRYYLGLDIPSYRPVGELPPLVPILLAGTQRAIPDPVAALQAFTVGLLVAVSLSFYAAGSVLLRSRVGGVITVVAALLITDRFLELLAFGGLFQLAAIAFINVAVAAFARAGEEKRGGRRYWALGGASLVLLALTHVGTATVGIPIGIAVAFISGFRLRRIGFVRLVRASAPFLVALVALAIYAMAVLTTATNDYVSNPASLAYRGPGRLMSSLFASWPTAAVIIIGAVAALLAGLLEAIKRSIGLGLIVLAWSAGAWGFLAVAAIAGTGTDYPRFAPVVLAPLVVAAAGAILAVITAGAHSIRQRTPSIRLEVVSLVAAGVLAVVTIPLAVVHYQVQMRGYQPVDAAALSAAAEFLDGSIGNQPGTVLTAVRDGKWLEGLTGREALFNLPVRFAVRPDEWQRSVDADVLLRASAALTNQFYFVKFSEPATTGGASAPTAMTISMNHGGEFVDVLELQQADTQLVGESRTWTAQAGPVDAQGRLGDREASFETWWQQSRGAASASFSRTVTLLDKGSTLSLVDNAPGYAIESVVRPAPGTGFSSVTVEGRQARICLTRVGEREPCLQLYASESDVELRSTSRGLVVRTTSSTRLSLYVTDLTAAGASVGLGLIDPNAVVGHRDIKAAILLATDPAFDDRRARLKALGLELSRQFGPYAVLQRP